MSQFPLLNDYPSLITRKLSLIDVRAPVEFAKGSLPGSVNLPILNDEERHLVGKCYKNKGSDAAVVLGHKLVSGQVKEERIQAWKEALNSRPDTALYCFRGGMRSALAQQWIKDELGIEVPRIEGGYKAVRRFYIEAMDPTQLSAQPVILGGRTGAGKTILLNKLSNSIDLEGIAHHRGSSFGHFVEPQPTQSDFENRLATALIRHASSGYSTMVLESEGKHVGRCYLPNPLAEYFSTCPLVLLDATFEQRVEITYNEYVISDQGEYIKAYGQENGVNRWLDAMLHNVDKISRRLGGERAREIKKLQQEAHGTQLHTGDPHEHKLWIGRLLKEYYDPMYDYKINKRQPDTLFRGNFDEVLDFLQAYEKQA